MRGQITRDGVPYLIEVLDPCTVIVETLVVQPRMLNVRVELSRLSTELWERQGTLSPADWYAPAEPLNGQQEAVLVEQAAAAAFAWLRKRDALTKVRDEQLAAAREELGRLQQEDAEAIIEGSAERPVAEQRRLELIEQMNALHLEFQELNRRLTDGTDYYRFTRQRRLEELAASKTELEQMPVDVPEPAEPAVVALAPVPQVAGIGLNELD